MLCYIDFGVLTRPNGFLKLFQVIISLVCVALLRHYGLSFGGTITDSGFYDRDILGKVTVGGMVVVTAPTLVANIFSEGQSLLTELLHGLIGSLLYVITGGMVLATYTGGIGGDDEVRKAGLAMGGLCVVNAFFYALDAGFTFARWRRQ